MAGEGFPWGMVRIYIGIAVQLDGILLADFYGVIKLSDKAIVFIAFSHPSLRV